MDSALTLTQDHLEEFTDAKPGFTDNKEKYIYIVWIIQIFSRSWFWLGLNPLQVSTLTWTQLTQVLAGIHARISNNLNAVLKNNIT